MMTIKEASEKFGLSYRCIIQRINRGCIPNAEKHHNENGHLVWYLPDDCVLLPNKKPYKWLDGQFVRTHKIVSDDDLSYLSYQEKRAYIWKYSISMPIGRLKKILGLTTREVIDIYDSCF